MVGRGTRIDEGFDKYMFRIYDYTNATRLFGKDFITKTRNNPSISAEPKEKQKIAKVYGFKVTVKDEGTFILMADEDTGKEKPVTIEEYKEKLAVSLISQANDIDLLREMWISPSDRKHLVEALPGGEKGALMLRDILKLDDCDLFDVLANVGFGTISKTRNERIIAFNYKNKEWLMSLPSNSAAVVKALAVQFKDNGIEELESEHIFDVSDIKRAGGVKALAQINTHVQDVIMEVKKRILAA